MTGNARRHLINTFGVQTILADIPMSTDLVFALGRKKIELFESNCVKSRKKSATICVIIKLKTDLEFKMPELSQVFHECQMFKILQPKRQLLQNLSMYSI